MWSRSRPGLRRSQAIWECPNRGPSGPVFLGKSQTWTGTMGFGLVQTGFQSVWDRTSPTLALRIRFSLSDRVSAGSGILDFDTTSSVAGGMFKSNISLVDPTIQFSRTEKQLVKWGVSFTTDQVKNLFSHLLSPPSASLDHQGRWLQFWR